MKPDRSLIVAIIAALALSACGNEKSAGKATAGGQILEGSASDAMLPLDSVRSQPPLAPRATDSGKAKDSAGPEDAARDATSPETATSAPTPADAAESQPRPNAE